MKIEINGLSKSYGKKEALKDINIEINEGMFGLLGPNGAGKTTLMRILTTLVHKTNGRVTIDGIDIEDKSKIRTVIGYLPQEFSVYPGLSVYETLDYLSILSGINDSKTRKRNIYELLEKVNLEKHHRAKVRALSGGMKRRLGIVQALLHNPRILIVDEPTAGLDPEERIRFRNLLTDFAEDRIVILSTHIVEDVEFTCESLAILKEGRMLYKGKVKELIKKAEGSVWSTDVDRDEFESIKKNHNIISTVSDGEKVKLRILSSVKPSENALSINPSIEDAYMKLIKGGGSSMFFQLVKKEIGYQFRNITLYLFIGIVLLFYFSQFTGDMDIKGIKPVPGQEYYGSMAITDKTEEMKRVYRNIKSNLNTGEFLRNGLLINKTVKLSEKDRNILSAAAEKIAVPSDGGNIELKSGYEEYLNIVRKLDKDLGGNTDYSEKNRKMILNRSMTYEEALQEFNNIINKDKITNAYGRLFGDYMGITAGFFPIFLSAFILTRDKRSRMYELIYTRGVKSHIYVFTKYAALVIVMFLAYLIAATHATVKFAYFAAQNNYIIDYFAFYKYTFAWILPTLMVTTAFGMLISIIFGNGIAAVPAQFIIWISSLLPLGGNYALTKILIRFNTLGSYNNYILWKPDIIINRIFYAILSVALVYITSMLLTLKRGGGFGQFRESGKNNILQCENNL